MTQPIVSAQWLNAHLNDPGLIILEASLLSNKTGQPPADENLKIKNARYFDLKNMFCDPNGQFPNTFPRQERFQKGCCDLGINNSSTIIVYDAQGIYTSPRVWWMFKVMGHDKVFVLDGGLPEWIKAGFSTAEEYGEVAETGNFTATFDPAPVKGIDFIKSNIYNKEYLVVDARSEDRFNGTVEEPRKGLRSGHIPDSINIPFRSLLENGKYRSKDELKEIFNEVGVQDQPLVFSCGSGITACIVLLASEMIKNNPTAVYDGSWTEWASLTKGEDG